MDGSVKFYDFNYLILFIAGYNIPSPSKYVYIATFAEPIGLITTKNELAMFLTHVLWESDGFRYYN